MAYASIKAPQAANWLVAIRGSGCNQGRLAMTISIIYNVRNLHENTIESTTLMATVKS